MPTKTKRPAIEDLSESRPPIEELSDTRPSIEDLQDEPPEEMSTFEKVVNVADIPPSLARTAVEAAISPEREVLPELGKQLGRVVKSPTTAASFAPTGIDVNETFIKDVLGETEESRQRLREEYPIAQKVISNVAGFVTETALDPFVAAGFIPKVKRVINTPIVNLADKQAAKVVARGVTKTALSSGSNIEVMSKRLVAEDLHGMLTNPTKIFESLAGEKYYKKITPDSLDTLRFEKVTKKKGKIAEVAQGVDDTLKSIENAVPELKNKTYPLDAAMSVVKKNIETNEDLISAQTIDLSQVGDILDKVLKPFRDVSSGVTTKTTLQKVPGSLDLEERIKLVQGAPKKVPSTLSLTDLQQLRKNVGSLLSDRTFYATPDKTISTEKEVLEQLHGVLGDMIYNDLKGIKIRKGSNVLDAGQYYKDQNDRLKELMNLRSLFQFSKKEELSQADMIGTLMSMTAQGGVLGSAAAAGEIMGIPQATGYALLGGAVGAGLTAGSELKKAAPEYLSKILSTAAKVSPAAYAAPVRGSIMYMREGQPVSEFGREPQSVGLTPKQLINYKIPRSTQGILEQKDKVIAKLAQSGAPSEMIDTVAQALNGDPEDLSNVAPLLLMQMPQMFEKSKYKVFDGKFLDPNDKAKAADEISKRDDLDSIQRAKMINRINKFNEVPEGL